MSATAFQRMRREAAAAAAEQVTEQSEQVIEKEINVDELSIDEVKEELDRLGVKYTHNTGLEKLKEKLIDAIN